MKKKSSPNFILGFSDEETVKLDFDQTPFSRVKHWAVKTLKHFKLRGFLILKSSEECYHVIFDKTVTWSENVRIVAWVSLQSHCRGLCKWFHMQCIKGCSTLRVSAKREKPSPRIVYRFGEQGENVKDFLKYRRLAKRIGQKKWKNRDS